MNNVNLDEGSRWLHRYLANTIKKTYDFTLPSSQKISYAEEMSEIKLCPSCAVQYIQLCKADDARFHSTFQDVLQRYEQFERKSLEIENRMMKYNRSLELTTKFFDQQQRYVRVSGLFFKHGICLLRYHQRVEHTNMSFKYCHSYFRLRQIIRRF